MRLQDIPIQRKLMSVILTTCAVVLLVMCTAYMVLEYIAFKEALRTHVSTLSNIVASNSSAALAFDSPKDGQEILNALKAEKRIDEACLYDLKGNIFAKYPASAPDSIFPQHPVEHRYLFADGFLTGFQPVVQEDKVLGTLYIKSNSEEIYAQLKQYALLALLLIAGSLVIASLVSKQLQKTISGPIISLEQTAKIVSEQKDYSVRAVKFGDDELGKLTEAFNHMLVQIQFQNTEIITFNQVLEQRVKERTNELENRNIDLKQQRDFIETIINSSVDIIVVLDRELTYVMLNRQAHDYYKLNTKELIGKNVFELYPDLRESQLHNDLRAALRGESVHDLNYKSQQFNRYFEINYIPLKDESGNVYGVLMILHDITDIMKTNEKLETVNRELLKSNRDLEQFAYVASHDLQEPLRKIQIFTNLLEDETKAESEQGKYLTKINQSALRMQQLIQDVLNFSRISNSKDAYTETDLNLILENIKTDFELLIKDKGAVINHPQLPSIRGIPLQLSQLFHNLISNSLKYSHEKPEINITYKNLTAGILEELPMLKTASNYILLQFQDNGIGFDTQYSEKIFTIFQRLHDKKSYGGTGIGLALCKKIVENHGGTIWAKSEKDKGATFSVVLPFSES